MFEFATGFESKYVGEEVISEVLVSFLKLFEKLYLLLLSLKVKKFVSTVADKPNVKVVNIIFLKYLFFFM